MDRVINELKRKVKRAYESSLLKTTFAFNKFQFERKICALKDEYLGKGINEIDFNNTVKISLSEIGAIYF